MKALAILLLAQDPTQFFETKVRPLFAAKCFSCHSGKTKMGGLDLSSEASFREVTEKGARLVRALTYEDKAKMPPAGKLPASEIADLRAWVEMGAPWPADAGKPALSGQKRAGKEHWAFQPVKKLDPPLVRDKGWGRQALDRFVLGKLEQQGLRPAGEASKTDLLRRVTYDVTGLPPAPLEIESFEKGEPYEQVVERLLASPRYGEQWGRHWLDVARFADSTGMDEDHMYPHAWRYRDYVVRAFNEDKPYDTFVREQIAGDLMYGGTNNEAIVATGFLALGPKPLAQQDRVKMIYDTIDEQIDVTSKAILGLTIACARCHDHKFDPILTRDYYSLAAIYANTKNFRELGRPGSVSYIYYAPLDRAAYGQWQDHRNRMYAKQMEMEDALGEDLKAFYEAQQFSKEQETVAKKWVERLASWRKNFRREAALDRDLPARPKLEEKLPEFADTARVAALRAEFERLEKTLPAEPPMASAVGDGEPVEQHVFVRGDHHNPGGPAPKAFPIVLAGEMAPAIEKGSGRLEFARWLTEPSNPLVARVIVNRVWQWHFGEGLVRTANNWGTTGERPSNPELLDYLARRLVELGWSIRALNREILLSSAYRMSRAEPRRMTMEEIRDSLLAIEGSLDLTMGGSLMAEKGRKRPDSNPDKTKRRTLYIPVRRGSIPTLFTTFDFGDATTSSEGRTRTNVAPQALFMMNSDFVRERASGLASRLLAGSGADSARVEKAYLAILGRRPEPAEVDQALSYVGGRQERGWSSFCRVLMGTNEFLYLK